MRMALGLHVWAGRRFVYELMTIAASSSSDCRGQHAQLIERNLAWCAPEPSCDASRQLKNKRSASNRQRK
jgi:hypothetical protein